VKKGEDGKEENCGLCSTVFQMLIRGWKWFRYTRAEMYMDRESRCVEFLSIEQSLSNL